TPICGNSSSRSRNFDPILPKGHGHAGLPQGEDAPRRRLGRAAELGIAAAARTELVSSGLQVPHTVPKGRGTRPPPFRVTDVDRTFEELTAKGARVEVEPFRESRYAFAFVSDPDGIWIELLGRVPVKS